MNDEYRGLAIFVAVHEAGSFSAAGRRLKLSTSVVSHHISKLEDRLGAALFFRSTRSLKLTREGERILDASRRMVSAGAEAMDLLSDEAEQPVGALRVTMPAFGMNSSLHDAIWQFAKAHPMVALSIHSSDKAVDLVRDGYDLAIRLGTLADSSLKSRRIGTFHRKIVATPDFLVRRPELTDLNDLAAAEFVSLSVVPDTISLRYKDEDVRVTLQNIRVEVDAVTAGRAAVLQGLGLMSLPLNEIKDDLETGALVEVCEDWQLPSFGIYAVWADTGSQKKLTRRLIDYLAEHSKQSTEWRLNKQLEVPGTERAPM
ncbi:Transcriptional regulator, LysR family [Candidatus Rhodobacter oscarellae]|uniref:Transcriptional regulator, LysR family n=1 Tax=Candidatus Rhodobacter oscarellae TaxID=1675527 RepID=A0A0J9E0E8_9RHOB|nr:LysR family transcriptional regulator [Candidatus Rhodobacter lobularis]KMW56195.1 Transcriptional regulator, LysR family [Candidatus Rhodobacter lobularis]